MWQDPRVRVPLLLLAAASLLIGCTGSAQSDDDDDVSEGEGEPGDTGFPDPRDDVTARIGADETLDIGAWNIKNFPCGNASFSTVCREDAEDTPSLVADVVASLALDIVAFEEITSEDAFFEVVQRLPHHEGVLSEHTYGDGTFQKIGFLYDARVIDAGDEALLFPTDDAFPRPALQVPFTWRDTGLSLFAIAVHLKAGQEPEDFERRGAAIERMDSYARNLVDGEGQDKIIMLGDFNETLTDTAGLANFAPLRDAARYTIRTQTNAAADEATFLPSNVILDHIVTTSALGAQAAGRSAVIPRVDFDIEGYRARLSDHLPVALSLDP
jgi:endonuclease/exonuclease/phosphatase family metal-dependent hydrolase